MQIDLSLGSVLLTDPNGYLINPCRIQEIQQIWIPVLDEIAQTYTARLGDKLHSLYLRGSVAQGRAIPHISDLDTIAVVSSDTTDADMSWVVEAQKQIEAGWPFVGRVEFVYVRYDSFLYSYRQRLKRFLVKTQSICLWGENLIPVLPEYQIGIETVFEAYKLDRDINLVRRLLAEPKSVSKIGKYCLWICKRLLRAAGELVFDYEQAYTRDLAPCYKIFSKYYPEKRLAAYRTLQFAVNSDKVELGSLLKLLDSFGSWLLAETRRKFRVDGNHFRRDRIMAIDRFGFEKIISPVNMAEFLNDYWESKPLIIQRNAPSYYDDLLSIQDVDHIITSTGVRYPEIRLVKDGELVPFDRYLKDVGLSGHPLTGFALPDKVLKEYSNGATVILQALHKTWKPLAEFCSNLEAELNCGFQVNVYLTPRNAQGFDAHFDTHDVFILQLAGTKRWRIFDSPITLPSKQQEIDISGYTTTPNHDLILEPGDMIYLPRGYIHEALTTDEFSLHITLGMNAFHWIEVLRRAVFSFEQNPISRQSLPLRLNGASDWYSRVEVEFTDLIRAFVSDIEIFPILEEMDLDFVQTRHVATSGQLLQINGLERLTIDSKIERRHGIIYRIQNTDESFGVGFLGKLVEFPVFAEPTLRFILDNQSFDIRALPGILDDPGKLVLVRRLVNEGFLQIAEW